MTEQASNTMFLASVWPLVSTTASPKQPQSLTGLATAIHTVISVIMVMKIRVTRVASRRRMAQSINTPIENSNAAKSTATVRVTHPGRVSAIESAAR